VTPTQGVAIISDDTVLKGRIAQCKLLEVHGYVEGEVFAERLVVHPGGRVFGTVKVDNAVVNGTLQGNITVRHLIGIGVTGSVVGQVQYGRIALESGAELSADLRNVPPEISGDLDLVVRRGRAVRITTMDLTAVDPDDRPTDLSFSISNATNGFVALNGALRTAIDTFTQADLERGNVMFAHQGDASTATASFDVIVADSSGATSGAARTVKVAVLAD
jgi:cytoskeletal protein CcmA (bactofilin family)